jgi:hypothetical protein
MCVCVREDGVVPAYCVRVNVSRIYADHGISQMTSVYMMDSRVSQFELRGHVCTRTNNNLPTYLSPHCSVHHSSDQSTSRSIDLHAYTCVCMSV